MKKIILIFLLISNVGYAKEESTWAKVKKYAIPCGLSLIAGAALKESEAGLVGCVAATGTVYVLDKKKKAEVDPETKLLIQKEVKLSIKEESKKMREGFRKSIGTALDQALQKNSNFLRSELDLKSSETREIMEAVLADEMTDLKSELSKKVLGEVRSGAFMSELKAKIEKSSKKYFEKNKKDLVKEATEATIKQVIKQEIGLPTK